MAKKMRYNEENNFGLLPGFLLKKVSNNKLSSAKRMRLSALIMPFTSTSASTAITTTVMTKN